MNSDWSQIVDEDGPVVYPANTFDSRLRGDQVPLGSSPTKSQKSDWWTEKTALPSDCKTVCYWRSNAIDQGK